MVFFIKIQRKFILDQFRYTTNNNTDNYSNENLITLFRFLKEMDIDDLLLFIDNPNLEFYQLNESLIVKDGKNIELYGPFQKEDENDETPDGIINKNNFKQIAIDWKQLVENKSSEIYFIQKENGKIIVRETLE